MADIGSSPSVTGFSDEQRTSSRKEKKKQAKEERDKLKQAEKKKRRLEKALATAAAIRTELETKKQRRKEEEVRLDEEGAALAEAVALRVLVDEDFDAIGEGPNSVAPSVNGGSASIADPEGSDTRRTNSVVSGGHSKETSAVDVSSERNVGSISGNNKLHGLEDSGDANIRSSGQAISIRDDDRALALAVKWRWRARNVDNEDDGPDFEGELMPVDERADWNSAEESIRESNERAKAAEVAAGLAASQALAALKIAEEARAEAEAAKKAAEEAMYKAMDRSWWEERDKPEPRGESNKRGASSHEEVDHEKEELRTLLQESQRKLREKSRRMLELEHDLAEMTKYIESVKARPPPSTRDDSQPSGKGKKKDDDGASKTSQTAQSQS